ncbi:TPA: anaerobic glycerol-3-phosphate dehydrogenase subunit C [Candidatus Poribacteria bacterium]|nr:anaerobic glycerol-3-phosphate dehydrogenase subunit C [Candidatus Poribacteria bacterium]HIO78017.1 anaerobic glycerol-3-phosphate dehydrogenase subunit C [Candidatus Poribacteria bacterium]
MNNSLQKLLSKQIEGEVRFDSYSQALYSTDASLYQITPIGVVIPHHKVDVLRTIQVCYDQNVPVLPRGGGTSLAGQAVGKAVVIDMSKYMNGIVEVNAEERWARVQPGIVLDELNHHLKPHGLMYAPDVATSSRANVGGTIGNNSAGSHSVIYGKTIDHVMSLDLILSNGEEIAAEPISLAELKEKKEGNTTEAHIYREICRLADENKEEIRSRYPRILRRVAGYNLDEFIPNAGSKEVTPYRRDGCDNERPFNLAKIIVGSEGTLATVTEAKINLVPTPKMTALNVIHFETLIKAVEAIQPILECHPTAVELIDDTIIRMTKESLEFSRVSNFIQGDPGAILVVEFYGEMEEELLDQLDVLEHRMKSFGLGYAFIRCLSVDEKARVWETRKAGLGLLMGMKGDHKPVGFVEDAAVPIEHLPEYIRRFAKIVEDHDTTAAYYAHASVGLLHNRPVINLKSESDIQKMHSIASQVRDLLMELGGAMSGEHGDGYVRSEWIESMFGSQIYQAFRQIKQAFDPTGIMNPGKIVDAPPMTENLRFGPKYNTIQIDTYFDFSSQGGFDRAIEMCNGVGACRKTLTGTMCPSFVGTREEKHSTRGRANALRNIISGKLPHDHFKNKSLFEVLDLCLECKACKSECPSNVDMAKIKYEFLAQYYDQHSQPLRNLLFGNIAQLSAIGSAFAPISNWLMNTEISKWMVAKLFGIDQRRSLPNFVRQTFEKWFTNRHTETEKLPRSKTVVLFHDTFMNYNYPQVGKAAVEVLEAAGFDIILSQKKCCGRPMISKGMIRQAIENAQYNIDCLLPYVEQGIPIIGCEPSCISALTDDYVDLIPGDESKLVAENTFMIEEFMLNCHEKDELDLNFTENPKEILLHGHCHQRALVGIQPSFKVLDLPSGYNVEVIDSSCCGMAGSFGYEAEHYDLSMKIGELRLFNQIRSKTGDFEVAVSGVSCREQIKHGTGKEPLHLIELIRDAIRQA